MLDKQEIKTVRIVKRESEKRHRDRDKGVYGSSQLDESYDDDPYETEATTTKVHTEPSINYYNNDKNPFINYSEKTQPINLTDTNMLFGNLNLTETFSNSLNDTNGFQSESARHIISELDDKNNHGMVQLANDADQYRRITPKKKKRHFTAPNTMNTEAMQSYLDGNGAHENV